MFALRLVVQVTRVIFADPAANARRQVSLLAFFIGVLSGGHVAGEEGAAGGVAAIPIDETTMLVSRYSFAAIEYRLIRTC